MLTLVFYESRKTMIYGKCLPAIRLVETLRSLTKIRVGAAKLLHDFSMILLQRSIEFPECSIMLLALLDDHVLLLLCFSRVTWYDGNEPGRLACNYTNLWRVLGILVAPWQ